MKSEDQAKEISSIVSGIYSDLTEGLYEELVEIPEELSYTGLISPQDIVTQAINILKKVEAPKFDEELRRTLTSK